MKIRIIAVGKLKEKFWKDAVQEYVKRTSAYAKLEIVEVPDRDPAKCGGEAAAMQAEGADILKAIPDGARTVLLAIDGKQYSSEAFAAKLQEKMTAGTSSFCFIIGGSCGVDDAVKNAVDAKISFGAITLPHNLARVVLVEQLYRAFKIMRGEPYHK